MGTYKKGEKIRCILNLRGHVTVNKIYVVIADITYPGWIPIIDDEGNQIEFYSHGFRSIKDERTTKLERIIK